MTSRFVPLLAVLTGCTGSSFERPATIVDGSAFPAEIRGTIIAKSGFIGGEETRYYLFGPISDSVRVSTQFVGVDNNPLPSCLTRELDAAGVLIDLDLESCQGVLLEELPGEATYSPFVRATEATVETGYVLNSIRSAAELTEQGVTSRVTDSVVDRTIIAPDAVLADLNAPIDRLSGWMDGLQLIYLQLPGEVPTDGDRVLPMELLVPEGFEPGAGADVLGARVGQPGYSPLCLVVYFRVPVDFEPGDVNDAAQIAAEDKIPSDPPLHLHCVAL